MTLSIRYLVQYVGYVYTEGFLYTAMPVHSIGTLHHRCANTRADLFVVSLPSIALAGF